MKIDNVFRVWDWQSREMVYFTLYQLLLEYCDEGNYHSTSEETLFQIRRDINVDTVMQFTGLHDKNGRDVYEGDIVNPSKHPYDSSTMTNHHEIVRYNKQALLLPFHESTGYEQDTWISEYADFEVIGNIYKNPELVKP